MSWFPVDDAFHSHPKARRAGFEAIGLWTVSGSYCMAYLTDGFVPEWFVKEKPKGLALAKRLVDAGLWRVGENAGETGWWFHQWKHECTKAVVLAAREKARQRKAKSRESQQESRRDSTSDEHRESRDMSGSNPTQPNPTHIPVVDLSGGVTYVDATGPRPKCSKHQQNAEDESCRPCMLRRKWDEEHAAEIEADELDRRRTARAAAARAVTECRLCDDAGWLLGADGTPVEPSVRCKSHESEAAHA